LIRSECDVPLSAIQNDWRHGGDGLDIVDYRRSTIQTFDGREGRLQARQSPLAFEGLHQCRFFAYFVGSSAGVGEDVELASTAEDALAEKAFCVCVGDRLLHDLEQVAILAAQIDETGLRSYGESSNDRALDHGVRIVLADQTVFAGGRLALIAVDQDVFRAFRLLGNE